MMFSQWLNSHRIFERQAKALISLRVCAGWSEPLMVAHTTLLEISCHHDRFPMHVDRISKELPILYLKGTQVEISKL